MVDNSSTPQITGEKSLIEHLLTSANDSARHFRSVYTVYLTVMLYAIVVALSIDQELIFREGSQQLPLVNINVPVVAFFAVMPWFLLVIHFYLLIQATFLADKVRLYISELEKSPWRKEFDKARKLLFPLPLAHIVSEKEARSKATRILSLIVFISLIVYPLVVLIGIQIRFLPYQSELITWAHRIVITIDVLLLWYFWLQIFFPKNENSGKEKMRKRLTVSRSFAASLIFIVLFIVVCVDFPSDKPYHSYTSKFHKWMETTDWIKGIGASKIMLNRFELNGYILVKKEPSPEILAAHYMKEKKPDENLITSGSPLWCKYAEPLDLSDRNFREARLSRVTLCNANLSEADLSHADLTEAKLSEAKLINADLPRANLSGADLSRANLPIANLSEAKLINVDLSRANLSGADLSRANLPIANLSEAKLINVDLSHADLTGTNLFHAELSEAKLSEAKLYLAYLSDADLTEADLTEAKLSNTDLSGANLSGAIFSDAILTDTNIEYFWMHEVLVSIFSDREGDLPIDIPISWIELGYVCPWDIDISDYSGEERKEIIEKHCRPYKSQEDP